MPAKEIAYAREPYFRESLHDASVVLGEQIYQVLQRITFLVYKPEAFAGRRAQATLNFLLNAGFTPILHTHCRFSRQVIREIWRYQLNAATLNKIDISTLSLGVLPAIMILLRDDMPNPELPASVRLKSLKGSATPCLRKPGTLRATLDAPNRMITFVHTVDEPADVVRELGVFFDRTERRAIYDAACKGKDDTEASRAVLEHLVQSVPMCDFDPEHAWERLLASCDSDVQTQLKVAQENYYRTGAIDWEALKELCYGMDVWDLITIGTAGITYDEPGYTKEIDFSDTDLAVWRNRFRLG